MLVLDYLKEIKSHCFVSLSISCVCSRYVSISSLSFSADAQFLCASSNTETVHIFKLEQHSPRLTLSSFFKLLFSVTHYLILKRKLC